MRVYKFSFFLFFAVSLLIQNSFAIVTADIPTSESDPSTISSAYTNFNWSGVYSVGGASGVAVDSYWLLTAKHVGASDITVGDTTYEWQETVIETTGADLRLIRYDKPFDTHYALYTGALVHGSPSIPGDVVMVGYGNTGTVSSLSWTDSGSGKGTKRWGTQEIDALSPNTTTSGGTSDGFSMYFSQGSTTYEAGAADKDSGGGTFVNDGGVWKLAGINVAVGSKPVLGKFTFAVSTQDYQGWINQTVPEPSIALFFGFTGVMFLMRRKLLGLFRADKTE